MAETKRKNLSKKVRFEVFKRDSFTCQYCGAKAPDVVLAVDHVVAVASGGSNNIMNLVTSCVGCNGGKGAVALSDDSAVQKRRTQAAALQQRREQIQMMAEWQSGLVDAESLAVDAVCALYRKVVPGQSPTATGRDAFAKLVRKYGMEIVCACIREAAALVRVGPDGNADNDSGNRVFSSLPAYCATRKLCESKPWMRDVFYVRGILRNRIANVVDWRAARFLEMAMSVGVSVDTLKDVAMSARNWTNWQDEMAELIGAYERRA